MSESDRAKRELEEGKVKESMNPSAAQAKTPADKVTSAATAAVLAGAPILFGDDWASILSRYLMRLEEIAEELEEEMEIAASHIHREFGKGLNHSSEHGKSPDMS